MLARDGTDMGKFPYTLTDSQGIWSKPKKNLMAMGFYDIKLYVRPFGTHIVCHFSGTNFGLMSNSSEPSFLEIFKGS